MRQETGSAGGDKGTTGLPEATRALDTTPAASNAPKPSHAEPVRYAARAFCEFVELYGLLHAVEGRSKATTSSATSGKRERLLSMRAMCHVMLNTGHRSQHLRVDLDRRDDRWNVIQRIDWREAEVVDVRTRSMYVYPRSKSPSTEAVRMRAGLEILAEHTGRLMPR